MAGFGRQCSAMLAGGTAGVLSFLLLHPIDCVKSVRQAQAAHVVGADSRLWTIVLAQHREHGARFFVRGIGATCLRAAPVSAVTFAVYDTLLPVLLSRP